MWTDNQMTHDELARCLARRIFEAPNFRGPNGVKRIAFKGAPRPNGTEPDYGGFCEAALAEWILKVLQELSEDGENA